MEPSSGSSSPPNPRVSGSAMSAASSARTSRRLGDMGIRIERWAAGRCGCQLRLVGRAGICQSPDSPDVTLGMRFSRVQSPEVSLDFIRPSKIAHQAHIRKLRLGEHAVEAATVGQRAYIAVNVHQIEAGETETGWIAGSQVTRRWILEDRQKIEIGLVGSAGL